MEISSLKLDQESPNKSPQLPKLSTQPFFNPTSLFCFFYLLYGAAKINNKKILTEFLILTIIFGVGGSSLLQAHAQKSTVDWSPTFHNNPARTGYFTSTGPLTNQTLWVYSTGNSVEYTSPAVVNGVLFVASHDHYVYALNAETGSKIWSYETGHSVESSVSYTHLRAHETDSYLVCRLLLEKKKS